MPSSLDSGWACDSLVRSREGGGSDDAILLWLG